jgi:hypothetical protein
VGSDFHRDLGFLHSEEELKPFLEGEMPSAVEQLARACGMDVTTARGLEPVMGYYGLLDRTPMGRNEQGEQVFWLRRHDEYETA